MAARDFVLVKKAVVVGVREIGIGDEAICRIDFRPIVEAVTVGIGIERIGSSVDWGVVDAGIGFDIVIESIGIGVGEGGVGARGLLG